MNGTDHPPSTSGSQRLARRALRTGLGALAVMALSASVVAAASSDDPAPTTESATVSTTSLDGQLELVRSRSAGAAVSYVGPAAPATPVVVEVPAPPAPRPRTVRPPAPAAAPPAPAAAPLGDPNDPATWDRLAQCESGGNWAINTGNGYYGGLQFSLSSWRGVGGVGYPHEASRETQIEMGQRLQRQGGWRHWPSCTRQLGYR